MEKHEVIDRVRTERSLWNDLLAHIDDDLMLKPGVEGDWSAKDILAHVMWYEREMVGMLRSRALIGSDLWALPLDERNAGVHEETKDMTLKEVRAESCEGIPGSHETARSPSQRGIRRRLLFPGDARRVGAVVRNRRQHLPSLPRPHRVPPAVARHTVAEAGMHQTIAKAPSPLMG